MRLRQEPPDGRHGRTQPALRSDDEDHFRAGAWCTNTYRISSTVVAPRIRGYRKNVHYFVTPWDYLDIDTSQARNERP